MSIHHLRASLRAALLALLAVAGMTMLSGWDAAAIHNDDPAHMLVVQDRHAASESEHGNTDNAAHIAAHAVGQGLQVPDYGQMHAPLFEGGRRWLAADDGFRPAFEPSSLLKPPQA